MRVGIWLEIHPNASWQYEGLGRLLRYMLSGADARHGTQFDLVVPSWIRKADVEDYLKELSDAQRKLIRIVQAPRSPNLLLAWYLDRQARRAGEPSKPRRRLWRGRKEKRPGDEAEPATVIWARRIRLLDAPLIAPLAVPMLVIGALLSGPLLGLAMVLRWVLHRVKAVARWFEVKLSGVSEQPTDRWGSLPWYLRVVTAPYYRLWSRFGPLLEGAMHELIPMELDRQAREVSRNRRVACWYVPHIGYLAGMHLFGKRVFLFPDYVFHDAPTGFHPDSVHWNRRNIKRVLERADHVIAMSNHVADRHVHGVFGYPPERISVVPHGFASLAPAFAPTRHFAAKPGFALPRVIKTDQSRAAAANLIRSLLIRRRTAVYKKRGVYADFVFPALMGMDFARGGFVLISTQNRPYKNTIGVIDAIEQFNRTAKRPLRLLMTGEYGVDEDDHPIGSVVKERGLLLDVMAIPRVPDDVHAALYHCADLAVHASFFEGGQGTFVFNEAVGLGTPTLVSRSLAHDEAFSKFPEYERFSFNPYAPSDLAALMHSVTRDLDDLWSAQFEVAEAMARERDWIAAHSDYVGVFRKVAKEAAIRTPPIKTRAEVEPWPLLH